jgi:hypothetical protein
MTPIQKVFLALSIITVPENQNILVSQDDKCVKVRFRNIETGQAGGIQFPKHMFDRTPASVLAYRLQAVWSDYPIYAVDERLI